MRTLILGFAFFILVSSPLFAQSSNAEHVVYEMCRSGILKRYKAYRAETEANIAAYKARSQNTEKVEAIYSQTTRAFENYIYLIQKDLLNPKTRRYISKHAESYMEAQLEALDEVYQNWYMNKLYPLCADQLTAGRMSGPNAPMPTTMTKLSPMVSATERLLEYMNETRAEQQSSFKELLQREWIAPNRFKSWDSL